MRRSRRCGRTSRRLGGSGCEPPWRDECRLKHPYGAKTTFVTPRRFRPTPTQPPLTFYRAYAAGTPPSTLSMFPVLLPDRAGEAKCSTAWAMSSGKMFTPSVVRLR